MSDEWKYKDLPRANGQMAPAKWDDEKKEWVPYTTVDKIEVTNLPEVQKVEVANQKDVQKVEVTNPADPVKFPDVQKVLVENQPEPIKFPDIQPVKDLDVNTRLLAIEQSNEAILTKLNGTLNTQVTGSKAVLSTDPKPPGNEGNTLLEYNEVTKETKVYKYISGDWREL